MTERFYSLYFGTDGGKTASVKVPDANGYATAEDIKEAMDEITDGGMCQSNAGTFTEAKRASYTQRSVTEFDIA